MTPPSTFADLWLLAGLLNRGEAACDLSRPQKASQTQPEGISGCIGNSVQGGWEGAVAPGNKL